jgi:hypothetical protein
MVLIVLGMVGWGLDEVLPAPAGEPVIPSDNTCGPNWDEPC